MKHIIALAVLLCFSLTASAEDVRHQPLKDLNGYFPFSPPESTRPVGAAEGAGAAADSGGGGALADADEDSAQCGRSRQDRP